MSNHVGNGLVDVLVSWAADGYVCLDHTIGGSLVRLFLGHLSHPFGLIPSDSSPPGRPSRRGDRFEGLLGVSVRVE